MKGKTPSHAGVACESREAAAGPRRWLFLHRLLRRHAEESITEEQVRQVLAPVLVMIHEGRFDRPRAKGGGAATHRLRRSTPARAAPQASARSGGPK